MISITSTPRVLHPSLGSTTSVSSHSSSSSPSATASAASSTINHTRDPATASSTSAMRRNASPDMASPEMPAATPTSSSSGSSNAGKTAECKRPKLYHVHSHSSRHVQLTDEITPREMALSIIQAQYHIYHTDLSGYLAGGAMVQDALTKYALGGSPKDLYQTYRRFRQDKERIPPVPTITITVRNWRDWLGHKSYYHDYLDFFDHELRQLEAGTPKESSSSSSQALASSWSATSSSPLDRAMANMVSDYLTPLIPGLCASTGALIHLGYGVEFGSRLATAEGLAYACISYQPATTCFIPSAATSSWTSSSTSKAATSPVQKRSPTVAILNMIRNDKRLDGIFDAGFQAKLNVVMSSRVSLLKSYLGMWSSQVHSVSEALLDLSQTSSLLLFTATNRFGDEQQLDKNLANVLLATHAARFLVKVLPSDQEKEQLLKAIWMSLVATYVVQGRHKLAAHSMSSVPAMVHVDPLEKQQQQQELSATGGVLTASVESEGSNIASGRWKSLSFEAIHADHQLVSKIVRSLWMAEREHGDCGDLFYEAAVRAVGEDPASDESSGPGF